MRIEIGHPDSRAFLDRLPVFRRRVAGDLFERPEKGGHTAEPAFVAGFLDACLLFDQKNAGVVDTDDFNIVKQGNSQFFLDNAAERVFGNPRIIRNFVEGQLLCIVTVDILDHAFIQNILGFK